MDPQSTGINNTYSSSFMTVIEVPKQDIVQQYSQVMFDWFKKISNLLFHINSFDSDDKKIIKSSFRVINILLDRIEEDHENNKFFATINTTSMKVYAFAIVNILSNESNEGELLYIAVDPYNLSLKDRSETRIRGAASELIHTISSKVSRLFVKPNNSALVFYNKLGFVDITQPGERQVLLLETPLKSK